MPRSALRACIGREIRRITDNVTRRGVLATTLPEHPIN